MTLTSWLVDVSVRVLLVALGVALILAAGRVRSSRIRHAAWTAVLGAMLLMPLAPYVIPAAVAVPIPADTFEEFVPPVGAPLLTDRPVVPYSSARAGSAADPPAPVIARVRAPWKAIGLGIYFSGVFLLLLGVANGWRAMQRLQRTARSLPGRSFLESSFIAAPVTVGVASPRIVLPAGWEAWTEEKLRAVLAHEGAHVQRRDPLIAMISRLNCCFFWFHPVAWWLERTLAVTAEQASDDEAMRSVGNARRYAEILLDVAETVRRSGGRVAWQGIGVNGSGLLGRRIDRALRGDGLRQPSRAGIAGVVAGCAAVILLVVACRPAALQPDPKAAASRTELKAQQDFFNAARALTPAQVAELEAAWKRNSDDLTTLHKLLIYYGPDISGKRVPDADRIIAARRPLILWLIEHHPDAEFAAHIQARIFPTSRDWLPDPAGYEAGKKLWLSQASKPSVTPVVLGNAASFLEVADKPVAEQLLLRAAAADPDGRWKRRLGALYGQILVGAQRFTLYNVVNDPDNTAAHSSYANEIRGKLEASTDPELLLATGSYLVRNASQVKLDFDHVALGKSYIDRAMQLSPDSLEGHVVLLELQSRRVYSRVSEITRANKPERQFDAVSALPEAERFRMLPTLAENAYMSGDGAEYYKHDRAAAEAAWDLARRYSQDALALAPKYRNEPEYGTAIYKANMTLSALAMRSGDKRKSVAYLDAASSAPVTEELTYTGGLASHRPLAYLVKYGEKEAVIRYLEKMAQINVTERKYLLESAELLRAGKLPSWYLVQIPAN